MRRIQHIVLAGAAIGLMATAPPESRAQFIYLGGNGGTVFGVTNYGAPVPGFPTYIANNITGRNDIMSSPGGTFQTANPVIGNNIASYGPYALPPNTNFFAFQVGGANGQGPFGSASTNNFGNAFSFGISDFAPAGGSASYGITSSNVQYTVGAGLYNLGSVLGFRGALPLIGSSVAVSLRTFVSSNVAGSPFFGGVDLPQLVLAEARNGGNVYSGVARGGAGQNNAAVIVDNAATGRFRGLAINNLGLLNFAANDVLTVNSTLTFYADPSDYESNSMPELDLIAATGTTLPVNSFVSTPVPEPTSLSLLGATVVGFAARRFRKAKSPLAA